LDGFKGSRCFSEKLTLDFGAEDRMLLRLFVYGKSRGEGVVGGGRVRGLDERDVGGVRVGGFRNERICVFMEWIRGSITALEF
jgi:hypothetical protein